MRTIAELEEQIDRASELLEEALSDASLSSSAELSAISLEAHIDEMRTMLRAQMLLRGREVVELRLRGHLAELGTLPLAVLGKIAIRWTRALSHTAYMVKFGTQAKKVPQAIAAALDLRLAGLAPGSARLFITGETSPDLFGRSLLGESLRDTFCFLQADSPDDLAEAVGNVGARAASSFQSLLEAVAEADLAVEINWEAPTEEDVTWSSDVVHVRQLVDTLSRLMPEEPEMVSVEGEVITVSSKRPFEIKGLDGVDYTAKVPAVMGDEVKRLRVGQRVRAMLEKQVVRNPITGHDKTRFTLRSVNEI